MSIWVIRYWVSGSLHVKKDRVEFQNGTVKSAVLSGSRSCPRGRGRSEHLQLLSCVKESVDGSVLAVTGTPPPPCPWGQRCLLSRPISYSSPYPHACLPAGFAHGTDGWTPQAAPCCCGPLPLCAPPTACSPPRPPAARQPRLRGQCQSFRKEEQKSSLIPPPGDTLLTVLFAGLFLFT